MADDRRTTADRTARVGASAAAAGGDAFDAMTDADRADQSTPVDQDEGPDFPDRPVGERFVDEADALDQEREEPLDDSDEYQPE
ncbi:hypothetical protein [Tomitella fengzijianii]|uniref:Uncharacterized protein n=1 Tax=Tomitella fengzijianii TaxID=2597660 RepID=A0A516X4C8_9ACTN|nr:hypothetical protein [Tomitella fengzijianii]QDQ97932.1 hypothetical protein FO059_12190 [Tomitella fengzijianii]